MLGEVNHHETDIHVRDVVQNSNCMRHCIFVCVNTDPWRVSTITGRLLAPLWPLGVKVCSCGIWRNLEGRVNSSTIAELLVQETGVRTGSMLSN